jgi:carboxymethylenebutenolidase
MIEKRLEIETPDGRMTTFIHHPEEGGPFPLVLYLMDAPSVRPALRDMASRLASAGYYVLLPYLYYRQEPYREFGTSDEDMHRRKQLMESLTKAKIVSDAAALFAHADRDPAAKSQRAGVVGFCMSGPFALAVAQAYSDRVVAAASIHGAWFVTDKPDSSDKNLAGVKAEFYFAWADQDATAPAADRETLAHALDAAGVRYRIEDYPGALHGFAPIGHPRYDRAASERHWERVHALLKRNLG